MGDFRREVRGGFGGRSRSSGSSFRGRSGGFGRGRDSGRFERRPLEMHEATCDKCGKKCEVPFKPTGGKPVYCSSCFEKKEGSGSRSSFSGMSSEQFDKINEKLDKIIQALKIK